MKKKQKRIIIETVGVILLILIALGAFYAYNSYKKPTSIPSVDALIKNKRLIDYKDKDDNKIDVTNYENPLPWARQEYGNDGIVGKLTIPNINIDTWIARAENNEFYLNYNLYRQYDQLGAPFFDYRNYYLNTDRQINIYGHNTTNPNIMDRLPLLNLEAYVDEGIFNNYKDIYLSIDERQIHYEAIAVKIITERDNEHMKLVFRDDNDFLNHTAKLLQNTLYKRENINISKDDKIIVLQICHYNPPDTFLLVIGKEIKV